MSVEGLFRPGQAQRIPASPVRGLYNSVAEILRLVLALLSTGFTPEPDSSRCCLPARGTAVTAPLIAPVIPSGPARHGWCQNMEG